MNKPYLFLGAALASVFFITIAATGNGPYPVGGGSISPSTDIVADSIVLNGNGGIDNNGNAFFNALSFGGQGLTYPQGDFIFCYAHGTPNEGDWIWGKDTSIDLSEDSLSITNLTWLTISSASGGDVALTGFNNIGVTNAGRFQVIANDNSGIDAGNSSDCTLKGHAVHIKTSTGNEDFTADDEAHECTITFNGIIYHAHAAGGVLTFSNP